MEDGVFKETAETSMTVNESKKESCDIYRRSVTVNDFSSALRNVLSQIRNAKKREKILSLPFQTPIFL